MIFNQIIDFLLAPSKKNDIIETMPIYQLSNALIFPENHLATSDGLLAVGGDFSIDRMLLAYRKGIFPWYEKGQPIMWWSPNPRFVLKPNSLKVSKSLKQSIRNRGFKVTFNQNFSQVLKGCKTINRKGQYGTWLTNELIQSLNGLHQLGWSHSVEVWLNDQLIAGVYGLAFGKIFFGESMFSTITDASKVGFVALVEQLKQQNFELIDCQIFTPHLASFGAELIPLEQFNQFLDNNASLHSEKLIL